MAFKLKQLLIKKVDMVNEGANPGAFVRLFKSKGGKVTVEKTADSFADKIKEEALYDIFRQIWVYADAIASSLIEILKDEEIEDKAAAMNKSLEQFYGAAGLAVDKWADGKLSDFSMGESANGDTIDIITGFVIKRLTEGVEKSLEKGLDGIPVTIENDTNNEGGQLIMKYNFDESKLTDEEKAQLSAIAKRAGVDGGDGANGGQTDPESNPPAAGGEGGNGAPVQKSKPDTEPAGGSTSAEEMYKGIPKEFVDELTALKKYREQKEEDELVEIAKKYEPLGKKPEELVPMFKSLKAVGDDAFNNTIAMLDSSLEAFNKSTAFQEVGSSNSGNGKVTSVAKSKLEAKAEEFMKSSPGMTQEQAILKAVQADPSLYEDYVKEAQ